STIPTRSTRSFPTPTFSCATIWFGTSASALERPTWGISWCTRCDSAGCSAVRPSRSSLRAAVRWNPRIQSDGRPRLAVQGQARFRDDIGRQRGGHGTVALDRELNCALRLVASDARAVDPKLDVYAAHASGRVRPSFGRDRHGESFDRRTPLGEDLDDVDR